MANRPVRCMDAGGPGRAGEWGFAAATRTGRKECVRARVRACRAGEGDAGDKDDPQCARSIRKMLHRK